MNTAPFPLHRVTWNPSIAGFVAALVLMAALACVLQAEAQEAELEFQSTSISGTVTMLAGRGGNIAVSAGEEGVYIVDDQLQPNAEQLVAEIRRISDQPIRFVINTHYHHDHVGGNELIGKSGGVIIAHDNVRQRMSTEQFSRFLDSTTEPWPFEALPVVTFSERASLHLNGEETVIHHVPRGHTDGDSIVHFTVSNVIHMGDIYFIGMYPYIDLDGGGTIQGMIAAVDLALGLANEDTRIIPGHGPLASRAELAGYRAFLAQASANVKALVDQGKTLEQAIAARPTAQWDEQLGKTWITPAQFVTFIYNSLTGVDHFTRTEAGSTG